MAKIGLPKGSGKRLKVRVKSVKSRGILKWIMSGNPDKGLIHIFQGITPPDAYYPLSVSLPKEIISECKLSSLQLEGVIHAVSSCT